VDNLCHTLVGVAASRAGLKHKSAFATTTLTIAANLPDLDVLAFATSIPAVALRRGWTHGPIAQVLLPVALAGIVHAIGRRRGAPTNFGWLLVMSCIGVFSHVFLDYLNTYGVRLLMPFSNRWFYGDAVFIVDIWLWLLLGVGTLLARRGRRWPARTGLTLATVYIALMMVSAQASRDIVRDRWTDTMGAPPAALMVGPVPVNPFRRSIIVDAGDRYVTGTFDWYPRGIAFSRTELIKNDESPLIAAARAQEPDFDALLVWSRFPFWTFDAQADGTRVTLRDARFPAGRAGFEASTILGRTPGAD
jgi:inner membrane protein